MTLSNAAKTVPSHVQVSQAFLKMKQSLSLATPCFSSPYLIMDRGDGLSLSYQETISPFLLILSENEDIAHWVGSVEDGRGESAPGKHLAR